jgi:restriction endonuclease S subunit
MSSALSNASIALMKREKVSLVAATGLIFEHLKKTSQDITLEKSLISYKGGTWGDESVEGIGFPVLRSSNMRGKRVDVTEAAWCNIPEEQAKSFALESGDILVTKSSGSIDLVGKAALFNDPKDGNTYLFSNFTMRLKPDRKIVIPEYLAWFLRSPQAFSWRFDKQQTTVGLRNLQTKEYLNQEIPIPDLDVQQQIVDYLNALENDNQDSNHLKLPTTLTEQRRIVAHIESLAARVNEAQRLREEADYEADVFINSSLNKLVSDLEQEYKTVFLEELLIDSNYGTSVKCHPERTSDATPVLRIPNVASEKVTLTDMKYGVLSEAEYKKTVLSEGDILVVRTNGSKDLVGRCAVVPALPEPMAFASYMIPTKKLFCLNFFNLYCDEQRRIVAYLDSVQARLASLRELQSATGEELSALLPSVLDRAGLEKRDFSKDFELKSDCAKVSNVRRQSAAIRKRVPWAILERALWRPAR